jgi:hypothetical protein
MMNEEYRVWNVVNPPNAPTFYSVDSPEAGAALIDKLARMQLNSFVVSSNAFGFETVEDDEWTEWCDEDGENIGAYTEV